MCVICENYDLCEKCEEIEEHGHPFLKIKAPSLKPEVLKAQMKKDAKVEEKRDVEAEYKKAK